MLTAIEEANLRSYECRWWVIDADANDPGPDGSPYELGLVCDGPYSNDEAETEAARRNAMPREAGIVYIAIPRQERAL